MSDRFAITSATHMLFLALAHVYMRIALTIFKHVADICSSKWPTVNQELGHAYKQFLLR